MGTFLVKRLLFSLVTLFAVLTLVFVVVRIVPGDPAQVILGDQADAAAIAALRGRLGLDARSWTSISASSPAPCRGTGAFRWSPAGRSSARSSTSALDAGLTFISMIIGTAIGVPLGVWAAVNRNRMPDYLTRIASLVGLSFPPFVSAILLLIGFSLILNWFPVISGNRSTPWAWFQSLTLPALNLGLIMAAYITRVAPLGDAGGDAGGLRPHRPRQGRAWSVVVWRHALRNALIPVVTIVGLYLGILIGNSVLTEIVFNRPASAS